MSEIIDYRPYLDNDFKVYVCVLAVCDRDGNTKPVSFIWEDGNSYDIDKITEVRPAASLKAGGAGIRYTVRVRNRQTYMFLEENRGTRKWFMERR